LDPASSRATPQSQLRRKKMTEARTTRKTAATKSADAVKPTAKKSATRKSPGITPEQRYRMIEEAAYYRAEHRAFTGGDPLQDWVQAEAEVAQRIGA
jgi:hypothetical protein